MRLALLGCQTTMPRNSPPGEAALAFFGDFFRQAKGAFAGPAVTRFVGYSVAVDAENELVFIGLEREQPERIPEGMVAWTLTRTAWEIQTADPQGAVQLREIGWNWLQNPQSGARPGLNGRKGITGEFNLKGAGTLFPDGLQDRCRMTANAPVQLDRDYEEGDRIVLAPYDRGWEVEYAAFAHTLQRELGPEIALRIEHIGSTAIPGMTAKPIIDVLIEIPSFAAARRKAIPLFHRENWEYWGYDDHPVFVRRQGFLGRRTHHVHLAPRGHREWESVAFRDHLRCHPDDAAAYARLKTELAGKFGADREGYTRAKGDFVRSIVAKATVDT